MTEVLVDDGVIGLRRWRTVDAAWYVACVQDVEIQRFTTDAPTLTPADVIAGIASSAEDPDRDAFLICTADERERLGNLAVEFRGAIAHLSYWVAQDARGRGAATAAVTLALHWLESEGRADRAELWAHTDNAGSRAVAERCGFVHQPDLDRHRAVGSSRWPTVTYTRQIGA